MSRHRFITDSSGWELAAGVVERGREIRAANAVAALLLLHRVQEVLVAGGGAGS